MSEPSAFAAASRAGSSQGRDGVDVMACARAGAGASNGTSGATSDSARPSTAAAGPAVFGTPLTHTPLRCVRLGRLKLDAFALRHERACSAGRGGATGAARNPLDFSAGWIARRRSISHARYLTNRLACPMTLALPQEKNW